MRLRAPLLALLLAAALAVLAPSASADHDGTHCDDISCGPPQEPCEPACAPVWDLMAAVLGPPGSDPCRPNCE